MAVMLGLFSCFSGSSKVAVEGKQTEALAHNKPKKSETRKTAPIPVAYFPIGSNLSRL